MKFRAKTIVVKTLRALLKSIHMLPVSKNKILFSAYEGMQYGCNPKYVFEYMYERLPQAEFVWVLNDPHKLPRRFRERTKVVKFLSPAHIRELSTSTVIISNLGIEPFLPKRKSQTFINTWHGGGAYKRVSWDMGVFTPSQQRYMTVMRELRSSSTDLFLSSCRRFTEVSAADFDVDVKKFVDSGMPRNDILINTDPFDTRRLRERICAEHGLDPESLLVLYAPTFRGTFREQQHLDVQVCCPKVADAFASGFGRPVSFMFRSHVAKDGGQQQLEGMGVRIADFTSYPDMQELLLIADVLITDYSSSIWDFALTRKPGFLFVPDIKEYMKTHGFYTPIDQWQFPHAETVEEFCSIISSYDALDAEKRIANHLEFLGSYETGNARKRVYDMVKEIISADADTKS